MYSRLTGKYDHLLSSWYSMGLLELGWGVYWPLHLLQVIFASFCSVICNICKGDRSMCAAHETVGDKNVTFK
jgi:hypothetical protein